MIARFLVYIAIVIIELSRRHHRHHHEPEMFELPVHVSAQVLPESSDSIDENAAEQ